MRLLTVARDLRRRKARERLGKFVAEGIRTVEELLRSRVNITGAIISPPLDATTRGALLRKALEDRQIMIQSVTDTELSGASDTDTPQGVLVIADIPKRSVTDVMPVTPQRLLVLDGVQDPGNLGTMIRTARAFGVHASLAMPGTVDLWNAKVVRGAMGAVFHHQAMDCSWEELDVLVVANSVELWGADAGGVTLAALDPPERLGVVVGNEGSGLSEDAAKRISTRLGIPIDDRAESLNVAVAAGIILYHVRI
ncbi:MAG: TrmH family RNA methyltransferase [Gemmatimonadaceae bacterium]